MSTKEQGGLSRRSFLKGAGVAAAAVAGSAALAGCSSDADASQEWLPKSWDYECDLLVIGYGGAGMWASLIGADECGQEVIVLEKAPVEGGGNSRINNGEWTIVEESDKERFKKYIKAFTHGKTPEPMIDAWVNECVRNTEYADKYGMTYEVSEVALAGAIPEYYFLDDNAYEGSCKLSSVDGFGMLSFRELDAQREKLGVQVLFDCHDERLIQNPETKEIVGAYTMIGSEEKTVKARKGVIMTTGGFEFNEDLKNAYLKCYPFKFEGWQFNTGDGIKMVEDVGAKLWHMDMAISMYSMWTRDPENDFSILYFMPANSYFNVNRLGKRYVNENNMGSPHNGWHTLLSFDDSIDDFDRIPSWGIFDQTCFDAGKLSTSQGDFFECGNFASDLPDEIRAWNGWSQDNKAELEKGWILKGDTIEEVVEKLGLPKEAVDTVKRYNELVAAGKDEDFNFPGEMMMTIDTPPYYATKEFADGLCTAGGLLVDTECRVLTKDRQPIDGLFAIGLTSGGMFFNTYPHNLNCLSHTRNCLMGYTVGQVLGDKA